MKEKLSKRIQELSNEATNLVQERDRLGGLIRDIEVRLHQITGAVIDLDQLLKELMARDEGDHKDLEGSSTQHP